MSSTRAPKVLHVITGLGYGGAEGILTRLVTASRAAPVESSVVSLTSGGGRREELLAAGVQLHELGMRRGRADPGAISRLAGVIRRLQPVSIQSWMYHADLLALLALYASCQRRKTRLYWGVRCSDMQAQHYGPGFRLVRRACAWLSGRPDGIVANSYAGRDVHIEHGYAARHFSVVPNGIDEQRFQPDAGRRRATRATLGLDEDEIVVFMAARVDPMKGFDVLAAAARRLPAVRFVVAGAGTEALEFPANVLALGHRTDLEHLLPAADVLLSTSLFGEGFSNSVAEGMAAGLCPVASDVGDARLILADAGIIYPPGDVGELIRALAGLAADGPAVLHERGRRARARIVAQFSVTRMVQAFDALHLHGREVAG